MFGLKTNRLMFERLDMLAHSKFRVMLAGVGMGLSFSPFPIALGVVFD